MAVPNWRDMIQGFKPSLPDGSLYIAIGIIGATVMPHNLYLHSALVQTRAYDSSDKGKRQACKFNTIDSAVALNAAFFVNAAILVVSAAVFFKRGIVVTELQQAHELLTPLLGTELAGTAFAAALLCAGQASTITGTLAGQIVMEGFLRFRIRPFLRRFLTRMLAVVPAVVTILYAGDNGTYKLLILSQVMLSLQLPFAVIPLVHFTSDTKTMGEFANNYFLKIGTWIIAGIITILNVRLVIQEMTGWIKTSTEPILTMAVILPLVMGLGCLLVYVIIKPFVHIPPRDRLPAWKRLSHFVRAEEDNLDIDVPQYRRIGVAIAFSDDDKNLHSALFDVVIGHFFRREKKARQEG